MIQKIDADKLHCLCCKADSNRIAYILYPMDDMLTHWIESAAVKYGTTLVVVTGMDWQNVFSPWPAKGVPQGSPDFKGESPEFLKLLCNKLIPEIESSLDIHEPERTLVGVSMSGLFALWQWMECDTFKNIASLSDHFGMTVFLNGLSRIQFPGRAERHSFCLAVRNQNLGSRPLTLWE